MKKFLLIAALFLATLAPAQAVTGASYPFIRQTNEHLFAAATTAGTPIRIVGVSATTFSQYRVLVKGTAGEVVTIKFCTSSATCVAVVAPVAGTPQDTWTVATGQEVVISAPISQAWINAISSTGTITIYISGGAGF